MEEENDLASVDQEKLKDELADVFAYALMLTGYYGFDVADIVSRKIDKNAQKYPVELSKGKSEKYPDL